MFTLLFQAKVPTNSIKCIFGEMGMLVAWIVLGFGVIRQDQVLIHTHVTTLVLYAAKGFATILASQCGLCL